MKNLTLSFTGLLNNLVSQAPRPEPVPTPEKPAKVTTTIRLEEPVRVYFEAQAANLGISTQECIALTLHAVMRASYEPQAAELERQIDRFFELFAAHDIPMTDIPTVIQSVSTLQRDDLLNRSSVLNNLDGPLIDHLSALFQVTPGWLKGLNEASHFSHAYLYKSPQQFARYLAYLKNQFRNVKIYLVLMESQVKRDVYMSLKRATEDEQHHDVDIRIIMERDSAGSLPRKTYEVLDENLNWNYRNCRYDIKAVMNFMERTRIFFDGIILPDTDYESLFSGTALAASVLKGRYRTWHPDQLVWDDERNTERHELSSIRRYYNECKMDEYEIAVRQPWQIKDWDKFLAGEDIAKLIQQEPQAAETKDS